jgi:hypothetical protein
MGALANPFQRKAGIQFEERLANVIVWPSVSSDFRLTTQALHWERVYEAGDGVKKNFEQTSSEPPRRWVAGDELSLSKIRL